VLNIELKTIV